MAASVTLTKVAVAGDGSVSYQFGKVGMEFASVAHARQHVADVLTPETLRAIAIALTLTRQPALGNPAAFAGKAVAVDFSQASWGTIL